MTDLVILSPCFYASASPADLMISSTLRNGLSTRLYGIGQPFIPHGADAQVVQLHDLMNREKLAEHVLVTDCRDVLFLADEAEIMHKYQSFGADLVMSCEQGCWPAEPEIVMHYYGQDKNGYNYINAGQYIGQWEYVQRCLKLLIDVYRNRHPGADNSQGWWMWARMQKELEFAMDHACLLFQSMTGGADAHTEIVEVSSKRRLFNKVTESLPCSVHFNGNPGNDQPQREMFQRIFA